LKIDKINSVFNVRLKLNQNYSRMNKLKNIALVMVVAVTVYSCQKETSKPMDTFSLEVASEEANVRLSSTDYTTSYSQDTEQDAEGNYTKGTLQYIVNNEVEATVDFGNGASNYKAHLTKDNETKEFDLKCHKAKSMYKKVIVKPLVKTDDCKYIVEGVIKYFDAKDGEYVATVDFGDGTCDEWAMKSWPDSPKYKAGKKKFSLDYWKYKKGEKK
jgi:hypothetical protein